MPDIVSDLNDTSLSLDTVCERNGVSLRALYNIAVELGFDMPARYETRLKAGLIWTPNRASGIGRALHKERALALEDLKAGVLSPADIAKKYHISHSLVLGIGREAGVDNKKAALLKRLTAKRDKAQIALDELNKEIDDLKVGKDDG